MTSKKTSLHPLLILLAVALVSVLFVVSCGGGATATAVPGIADETAGAEAEPAGLVAAAEAAAVEEAILPGTPKRGGTLTMAMVLDSRSLDPHLATGVSDLAINQSTYDNLVMIQPDLSIKRELATSWEANDDLSSYTFYLREGVKFHGGKDFKAEDVLFSFNRVLDPTLDSPGRSIFGVIEDIVALDDYTVRFDLVGPNSFFPTTLANYHGRILRADADVSRLVLEEFGTGPFMIEEHLPGERTVMVRNPDYWEEGRPFLDELIFQLIPDASTRAEALKSGDVDLLYQLEPQSIPGIEANPDTMVLEVASLSILALDMDVQVEPFDNKLVRKAMQAATDREAILQAALLGRGNIAYDHPVHPNDPLFAPQYAPPDYDPDLARSLLEQAGYPDGIDIVLHTGDVGPGMIEMAVAFKESAAPAGIRVEVRRESPDRFWDEVWGVKPFTVVYWWGEPTPDSALSLQYHTESSWNAPNYYNDTLDALLVQARGESFEDAQVSYAEIQRILIDDVPRMVVGFQPLLYGARTNVRGALPHPLNWAIFNDAWLDD